MGLNIKFYDDKHKEGRAELEQIPASWGGLAP